METTQTPLPDAPRERSSATVPRRDESPELAAFAVPEVAELRREAVGTFARLVLLLPIPLLMGLDFVAVTAATGLWLAILSLWACGLATLQLRRWGTTAAAATLVLSLIATCVGVTWISASAVPLFALPAVVVVGGAILGPVGALASAGLAAVALLLPPTLLAGVTMPEGAVLPTLFYLAVAVVLVWLGFRPLQVTLAWAWGSYSRLRELSEQLRQHQAELAEALRGLNLAYERLERTSEELARARVAADGARRLKAEFAAKISHELRTPLNLVIGFSEMLMTAPRADDPLGSAHSGEVALPEIYRDDVEAIYRNAQHLSTLIDDVLELGEIEAGRMGLRKEWTSAADIVEEATAVVRSLLVDRGLTATVAVPADLPSIFVDRTRIRQVLINLLINAARFTDQGGVRIGGRVDGHDLVVTVADTGVGISSRDLPLVFEEFRQFETALQRRAGGSGLGLAICKTLVELHGGNIWVESTPGRGTTVSFALPLTQNVAAQPLRAPWETWAHLTAVPKHEARSIVVLSHDPGQARIFQRHLDGFEIVPATDPQSVPDTVSAIAVVRVLDEHDDLQVAAKDAERLGTRAPLVLCRMPSARDVRRQMRVFDYLVKPFTRDQLLAVVARLPRPPQRVLVADDDADMTALITRVLRSDARDRHVFAAADGASTLELLHRPRPRLDLLILDLAMPAPDGFAILQEIRATPRLSHLPVIVVSARAFSERGVTASVLAVTRASGLTVRELMGCTRALVDTLAPD